MTTKDKLPKKRKPFNKKAFIKAAKILQDMDKIKRLELYIDEDYCNRIGVILSDIEDKINEIIDELNNRDQVEWYDE